MKRKSLNLG
jgi:mitogen-activated protein kinase 1/3